MASLKESGAAGQHSILSKFRLNDREEGQFQMEECTKGTAIDYFVQDNIKWKNGPKEQ